MITKIICIAGNCKVVKNLDNDYSRNMDKKYTEKEVQKILERAIRIQIQEQDTQEGEGMDHNQLLQLGRDLGLQEGHILRSLPGKRSSSGVRLMGASPRTQRELHVSRSLSQKEIEDLFVFFGEHIGSRGEVTQVRNFYQWKSTPQEAARQGRTYLLSIELRGEETYITMERTQYGLAGGLYGGIVGGVTGGLGLGLGLGLGFGLGMPFFALAFPLGSLVFSYSLAYTIYNGVSRNRDQKADKAWEFLKRYLEA